MPELASCMISDLRMPRPNGLQLQELLRCKVPFLSIVFVTGHGDVPVSVRAMKAGAVGFLEKPIRRRVLLVVESFGWRIMHGGSYEIMRFSMQVAAHAIELLAVAIILAGVAGGTARFLFRWTSSQGYNQYKETLGKALLLGLNVLVAADIVRTVALEPTITNILGLGLLVLVRTFVSWSLLVELEERWPWQVERSLSSKENTIDKAKTAT